ncbi:MAG: S1 family peptidase, partial [Nannocystaceae bacterium]|nr:S1 family peptidase [Nannocystaceae bacterium]
MMVFPTEASAVNGHQVGGACDWPTTVALVDERGMPVCSGTLIHPSLVVTSARCMLEAPQSVVFGDNAFASEWTLPLAGCIDNLTLFGGERVDLAVCQLAEPASDVPIVPILMGCESEVLSHGTPTVIVGFGNSITSDTLGNYGAGPKRFGELEVELVREDTAEVDLYDAFDGVCHGDWGGSAFVQLPDGTWRLFGAAKSIVYPAGHVIEPGFGNQCGDGAISRYSLLSPLVEWMESETLADLTPCFDSSGQWDPDDRCTPFPTDINSIRSTWREACVGALGGEPTCGDFGGGSDTDSGEGGSSSTSGPTKGTGGTSESGPQNAEDS